MVYVCTERKWECTKIGERSTLCAELRLFIPRCIPQFHATTNYRTRLLITQGIEPYSIGDYGGFMV